MLLAFVTLVTLVTLVMLIKLRSTHWRWPIGHCTPQQFLHFEGARTPWKGFTYRI